MRTSRITELTSIGKAVRLRRMKSIILYGSFEKLSNAHKLVSNRKQPEYYVRMDTFCGDMNDALSKAKPMDGELVLNTTDIPQNEHNKPT